MASIELNALLHLSALFAYLEFNVGHYFQEGTSLIQVLDGAQLINFSDQRMPSYGNILNNEPQNDKQILMDEEYFYAIMLPPLLDRSWILVLAYDEPSRFIFYWTTELQKIYQRPMEMTHDIA